MEQLEQPIYPEDTVLEIAVDQFSPEERARLNIFMEGIAKDYKSPRAHWNSEEGILSLEKIDLLKTPVQGPGTLRNAIDKILLTIKANKDESPSRQETAKNTTDEVSNQRGLLAKIFPLRIKTNPQESKKREEAQKAAQLLFSQYQSQERQILLDWVTSQVKNPKGAMAQICAKLSDERQANEMSLETVPTRHIVLAKQTSRASVNYKEHTFIYERESQGYISVSMKITDSSTLIDQPKISVKITSSGGYDIQFAENVYTSTSQLRDGARFTRFEDEENE